jgi:hypothetical protein
MKKEMEAWKEAAKRDLELPMDKLWSDVNTSWKT